MIRTFKLNRKQDATGVSGTGIVAEGVMFTSGKCVVHWLTKINSIVIFDSFEDVKTIHGHGGMTEIEFDAS